MKDILIVDDDLRIGETVSSLLALEGYSATYCNNPVEAVEKLNNEKYRVLVTDMKMPNITGLELLIWAKTQHPHLRSLMMTAYPTEAFEHMALAGGALNILRKPFNGEELIRQIRLCMLPGLSTEVSRIEIGELLQILALEHIGHTIEIHDASQKARAYISLDRQTITYSEWNTPDEKLLGYEACERILALKQGSFQDCGNRFFPTNFNYPLQDALLSAATRQDHAGRNDFESIICFSRNPRQLATLNKILENQGLSIRMGDPDQTDVLPFNTSVLYHLSKPQDWSDLVNFCRQHPKVPVVSLNQTGELYDIKSLHNLEAEFCAPWPNRQISETLRNSHQLGLSGYLSSLGLLSQLQMFLMSKKRKRLSIKNLSNKTAGSLYIDKGRLIEAEVNGKTGEEAFAALTQAMSGVVLELDWCEPPSNSLEDIQPFKLFMKASQDLADLADMQKFIIQKVESQLQHN